MFQTYEASWLKWLIFYLFFMIFFAGGGWGAA